MPDLSGFRSGLLALLGEPSGAIVFRVDGREVEGTAAFREPFEDGELGSVSVSRTVPQLLVRGADWDTYGAKVGDYVTVRGREFEIVSFKRDDSDLVEASLRESR